jgi:DNA-directed RNA polymerase III subunit RPC2
MAHSSHRTSGALQLVKSGRMDFNDFLTRGLVEYVDVNEENNSLIALYEADLTPQVRG